MENTIAYVKSFDVQSNYNTDESITEDCFLNSIYEFATQNVEPPRITRKYCERCSRPATVCWCPYLPKERINTLTTVYILQHPLRYNECPNLAEVLRSPNTLLLFPGDDAVDVEVLTSNEGYNLVVIDGTWSQARGMYANNELLKRLKKVQIASDRKSRYVIRTQPTDTSLSTLESVAVALATLERRPELVQVLTAPLEALCDFQLSHGAVPHQSKEYRIAHGQWTKMLPKGLQRRLDRERRLEKQTATLNSFSSGDLNDSVGDGVHCVGKSLPVDDEESDVDRHLADCFSTDCDIDNSPVICHVDIRGYDGPVGDDKLVFSEEELNSVGRKCEQTCALPCS